MSTLFLLLSSITIIIAGMDQSANMFYCAIWMMLVAIFYQNE